ncbi:hypothetical protein V9T40_004295 [Parthenolecanium corni]|uniref:Biopterin-dependent aromatic amino acid hydroxylase family profile domain-containing protein n=1 Tax=Parthenolecanium corni TaxID=536013 RepID=A0AAN9YAM1_9HEMI
MHPKFMKECLLHMKENIKLFDHDHGRESGHGDVLTHYFAKSYLTIRLHHEARIINRIEKYIRRINTRRIANSIQRPFGLRYNPYTQSVEVLSNAKKIAALVSELRGDLCIVSNTLRKIHAKEETVESITHMLPHGINVTSSSTESNTEEEMKKFKGQDKLR